MLAYVTGWAKHFASFDKPVKLRIVKKLEQLKTKERSRHLKHGSPYFVEEVGGYRIAFKSDEKTFIKTICFVGDHKQYEAWYRSV